MLAVSGGADSSALAVILHLLAPRLGLILHAASINHGLRAEAADDAAFARDLCCGLGIPCKICVTDAGRYADEKRVGIEEACRLLRYSLLEKERQACGADGIALGHHVGDLSEDVLLRLVRGTGWPALGGMAARDDARHLLRPLLAVKTEALRTLLVECGIAWREDSSNADQRFTRNRFRHRILPLLRNENPSLERSLFHLWHLARLDEAFWERRLDNLLAATPWRKDALGIELPAVLLRDLPPAARLRVYMRAIHALQQDKEGGHTPCGQARADALLALDTALSQGRGNTCFQLPGRLEARIVKGAILFRRTAER